MSGDLTMSGNTAGITHSGTTSLTISSSSGTVAVESVVFTGDAVSAVSTLGMSGTPNFIVGTDQVPSANIQAVEQLIEAALAES